MTGDAADGADRADTAVGPNVVAFRVRHQQGPAPVASDDMPSRPRRHSVLPGDIPEGVTGRYLSERSRAGGELRYFENASDLRPMMRDRGDRLFAETESRAVIRDMVAIASHRGWDRIVVAGTEPFRRQAWREGGAVGLEVSGYRPTVREIQEIERETLRQTPARARASEGQERPTEGAVLSSSYGRGNPPPRAVRADFSKGVEGRIVGTGRAPFSGRAGAKPTAFVELEMASGRRERAWGAGLPDALKASGKAAGDLVRITRLGSDRVDVPVEIRDPQTGATSTQMRGANRNRWSVEGIERTSDRSTDGEGRSARVRGNVSVTSERDRTQRTGRNDPQPRSRDRVERAFNAGDELLGVRTAPTRDTVERTREPSARRSQAEQDENQPSLSKRRPVDPSVTATRETTGKQGPEAERTSGNIGQSQRASRGLSDRTTLAQGNEDDRRPGSGERKAAIEDAGRDRAQPRGGSRALADRFRQVTSAEAANDPELRAAQSQFVAAKALVRAYLPNRPEAAAIAIQGLREQIARNLEHGRQFRSIRLRQDDRGVPEIILSVREHDPSRAVSEHAASKSPQRGRGR